MSSPLITALEDGQSNISLVGSSSSPESITYKNSELKERNYMGLSECSSVDSSAISVLCEEKKRSLNLRATELTLGLPGTQCPENDTELCLVNSGKLSEKSLFPLLPSNDCIYPSSQKTVVLGSKRGFPDSVDGVSKVKGSVFGEGKWMFPAAESDSETAQSMAQAKLPVNSKVLQERLHGANDAPNNQVAPTNSANNPPAAKAQVVGWPPIRSFRKNTLVTSTKNNEEVDGKPGPGALFLKVSMDGAPYLRKVDLRTYYGYQELSSALEKMFSCFTIGQCGPHGAPGKEMLSESKLRDLLHGSEYVLTYEDKDGDWMLVGDVPWEMFIDSCKRLRIMKSSDAIGLAPRVGDKCRVSS